ncbi:MAG: hypothetical protein AN487_22560 [Anabaena sp. CRKS33]|nr:MAG: hypothetical protein AN487_22560 [Anabaena sp. CRKS33]
MGEASGDEKEPSSSPGGLDVAIRGHESQEEIPDIVNQEQQPDGQFAHRPPAGAEPVEAPLVFEFIEDILRIGPFAVEIDELPGIDLGGIQVGDIGLELMEVLIPEGGSLLLGQHPEYAAADNHPALATPPRQLQACLGNLENPSPGRSLPAILAQGSNVSAHIGRDLQLQEEAGPSRLPLMPCHDFFLPQSDVSPIEPDLAPAQPALTFLHGSFPLGGGYRVARPKLVVRTHAGSRRNRQQGMKTPTSRLAGVITDLGSLLVSVFALHRGVPVQDQGVG